MGAKTRSQSRMIFNPSAPGNRVRVAIQTPPLRARFTICLLHEIRTPFYKSASMFSPNYKFPMNMNRRSWMPMFVYRLKPLL